MIGIIYKFTIKAKYMKDGHKPFYIGQHWCRSVGDFLCRDYPYYGSGAIWNDFLNRLKKDYPKKWRYFIKREVLCTVTNNSQKILDRLEEFWIKREKSHYSFGIGGCNVLWGAAIVGDNPMYDSTVRQKASQTIKHNYKLGKRVAFYKGKHLSKEHKRKIGISVKGRITSVKTRELLRQKMLGRYDGENNPNYGHKWSEDKKKELSIRFTGKNHPCYGKHHSEETRRKISLGNRGKRNGMFGKYGELNPNYGKHLTDEVKEKIGNSQRQYQWYTDGEINLRIKIGLDIPSGFSRGRTIKKK